MAILNETFTIEFNEADFRNLIVLIQNNEFHKNILKICFRILLIFNNPDNLWNIFHLSLIKVFLRKNVTYLFNIKII